MADNNGPLYPPIEGPIPEVWTQQHLARAEESLRQLAVVDHILQKCERCNIPNGALRADCDGLCRFFQSVIEEMRGQQAALPQAVG